MYMPLTPNLSDEDCGIEKTSKDVKQEIQIDNTPPHPATAADATSGHATGSC